MSTQETKTIVSLKLIHDASKLSAAIVQIGKDAHKLADHIQVAAASATFQAVMHGNVNQLNELVIAAGRGTRRSALAAWIMQFAPVMANDGKDAKDKPFVFSAEKLERLTATKRKEITAEVAEGYSLTAGQTHWTEYKEPPLIPEKYDLGAQLAHMVKQAEKLAANGKTQIIGADLLPFVKRLAEKAAPLEITKINEIAPV